MKSLKKRRELFLSIFKKAEKKYRKKEKRLSAEGWGKDWQVLIATILSAQSRDETTIPIAEELFKKYPTLKKLAGADYVDVYLLLRSMNYNKTKTANILAVANIIVQDYQGKVPDVLDSLIKMPGVGRKTGNLFLSEVHKQDRICVDTHVHRISNVLGLVKTKNPEETENELMKIVPKRYWSRINRIFVLWGKDVRGRDKKKILGKLEGD